MKFYRLTKYNNSMRENEHVSYHSTLTNAMNKAESLGLKSKNWFHDVDFWECDRDSEEQGEFTWLILACPLED